MDANHNIGVGIGARLSFGGDVNLRADTKSTQRRAWGKVQSCSPRVARRGGWATGALRAVAAPHHNLRRRAIDGDIIRINRTNPHSHLPAIRPRAPGDGISTLNPGDKLIGFTTAQLSVGSALADEYDNWSRLYAAFGDPAFRLEMDRVIDEAQELGLVTVYPNGTVTFIRTFVVPYVTLDNIHAESGFISIVGDSVTGSGQLDAPGDVTVEIQNDTPAFLRVQDINIPQDGGGAVVFNDVDVDPAEDPILGFNFGGSITSIYHSGTGSESAPAITIHNTYSPGPGGLAGFDRARQSSCAATSAPDAR